MGLGMICSFTTNFNTDFQSCCLCPRRERRRRRSRSGTRSPKKTRSPKRKMSRSPSPRRSGKLLAGKKNGVWVGNSQAVTYREDPRGFCVQVLWSCSGVGWELQGTGASGVGGAGCATIPSPFGSASADLGWPGHSVTPSQDGELEVLLSNTLEHLLFLLSRIWTP